MANEQPKPSTPRAPLWVWVLSAVVALQCVAMAVPILFYDGSHTYRYITKQIDLRQANEDGVARALDAVISGTATEADYAVLDAADSEPDQSAQDFAASADRAWGYGLLAIALGVLLTRRRHRPLACLLVIVSAWYLADSISAVQNGGKAFSSLSPYGAAARIASPLLLAMFLLVCPKRRQVKPGSAAPLSIAAPLKPGFLNLFDWLARVAIMLTFASHGYKAVYTDDHFQDLINLSARRVGWGPFSSQTIDVLLKVIGIHDLILALLILLLRSRILLFWIAGWGIITALSRMTAMGLPVYHLTMVRAANGGLALALIAIYHWHNRNHRDGLALGRVPLLASRRLR